MFSTAEIVEWLRLGSTGANVKRPHYFEGLKFRSKIFSVNSILNEWNLHLTDWVFHPSQKNFILNALGVSTLASNADDEMSIIGARVHFNYDLPRMQGMALSLSAYDLAIPGDSRCVVLFPM